MAKSRILIVDDSRVDRLFLQRAFDKVYGVEFELEEATDALSAIDIMTQSKFDAIFLDINMPGHDGFYVLSSVRSENPQTWPLVFMYSSSSHPDDISKAYKHHATAFINKPNEFARVREVVFSCGSLIQQASRYG